MNTRDLTVSKKIQETSDAFSFVFEIPGEATSDFNYEPGQFITLVMNISGEEVRRSYSIATCPKCDSEFKVTVKRVTGGKGSNYLIDQVEEGQSLTVTPPAGRFTLPDSSKVAQYIFIAGGSGITPIIAMIKQALCESDKKVLLVYANRDSQNIIFGGELKSLEENNGERLTVVHALSANEGRLTGDRLRNIFDDHDQNGLADYFMCGPEGLMSCTSETLQAKGIGSGAIHKESFTTSTENTATATEASAEDFYDLGPEAVVIGDPGATEKPGKILAVVNGENVEMSYEGDDSILETLINAGQNPPYSCMDGACMACLAKVVEGRVIQEEPGILTDENVADRECLTCQARPASAIVKIDYDEI